MIADGKGGQTQREPRYQSSSPRAPDRWRFEALTGGCRSRFRHAVRHRSSFTAIGAASQSDEWDREADRSPSERKSQTQKREPITC
jgi:hypothetical protein